MNPQEIGILIVDDEFSVRDSLASWFEADGFRVSTAEDGNEALRKLQDGEWNIVLLDIKMPGMDGIELQRHNQKNQPKHHHDHHHRLRSVDTAIQALKDGLSTTSVSRSIRTNSATWCATPSSACGY
jgi:DNA-binding NtrC family response regulator